MWETWCSPEGERIRSFTIITTTPNALCAELHDRMPVVLEPSAWPDWLGEEPADPKHLNADSLPFELPLFSGRIFFKSPERGDVVVFNPQ